MKWSCHLFVVTLSLAAFTTMAFGDVFQWTDTAGVTHYTNLKSEIPAAARESVQVIVDEAARQASGVGDTGSQTSPPPAEPARWSFDNPPPPSQLPEASYDQSQWLNAYLEGLQRGLSTGGTVATGGSVEINGPLVVSPTTATVPAYYYDTWPYAYGYGWPYYAWPVYFSPAIGVLHHHRHFRHPAHLGAGMHPRRFGMFQPSRSPLGR